jgi:hypothetical protein
MRHRTQLDGLGLTYRTLVDGSYLSTKLDPSDIDICVLFDGGEINALSQPDSLALQALFTHPACKDQYNCDAYSIAIQPFSNPHFSLNIKSISYWTRVFGTDRQGNIKAFVMLDGPGTI